MNARLEEAELNARSLEERINLVEEDLNAAYNDGDLVAANRYEAMLVDLVAQQEVSISICGY